MSSQIPKEQHIKIIFLYFNYYYYYYYMHYCYHFWLSFQNYIVVFTFCIIVFLRITLLLYNTNILMIIAVIIIINLNVFLNVISDIQGTRFQNIFAFYCFSYKLKFVMAV